MPHFDDNRYSPIRFISEDGVHAINLGMSTLDMERHQLWPFRYFSGVLDQDGIGRDGAFIVEIPAPDDPGWGWYVYGFFSPDNRMTWVSLRREVPKT